MVPEPKVIGIRLQVVLHLDVTVVLVSAVVADRIAEQAAARADGDPLGRLGMAGGLGRDYPPWRAIGPVQSGRRAMKSISIRALRASAVTPMQVLAGRRSGGKYDRYTSFIRS